jgi:double-strand break repair protein MRE11
MSGQGAGKCTVSPVLLKKGDTKLALFGLGYLRDARLYRMLNTPGEVTWNRPVEDESCWFNLFFIHQNRVARKQKNFVSEGMLPNWLDFVVWGHEHACKVEPQPSGEGGGNFMVSQPGSSCVVSLSEDEAIPKAVLLLDLKEQMYRATPVPLTTSRPFVFRNIALQDQEALKGRADDQEAVFAFLQRAVNEAIATAGGNNNVAAGPATGAAQQQAAVGADGEVDTRRLPLIRLRVDHSGGFPTVPLQRFGASFVQRVANPWDLLQFHKAAAKRGAGARKAAAADDVGHAAGGGGGLDDDGPMEMPELDDFRRIDALVSEHLPADLAILAETDMAAALEAFVQQDEKGAIEKAVSAALLESQKRVAAKGATAEAGGDKELFKVINQSVAEIKSAKQKEREAKQKATAAKAGAKAGGAGAAAPADEPADEGGAVPLPMDEDDVPAPAPAQARGAKAPKQARGAAADEAPRPPRRAAAKKKAIVESSEEEEEDGVDDDEEEDIRPVRKRARAPAAREDDGAAAWSDGEDDRDEPTPPRGKGAAGGRGKAGAAPPRASGRKPAAAPAKKGRKSAAGSVPASEPIEVVDLVDSGDDEPAAKAPRATAPAPGGTAVLPSQQPSLGSIRGGWGSLRK